jgi:aryl-alcohol dehydrogenase-like predicted oxidoreductase
MIAAAGGSLLGMAPRAAPETLAKRPIPSSGEPLAVIGIGTWRTFDVGSSESERKPLEEVLSRFVEREGRLVDTSPMYGRAESVMGDLAAKLDIRRSLFLATKVWTRGRAAGIEQMQASLRRLRTDRVDLMQVHNLIDVETHLATLAEWKREGRIRYLGVTHYDGSAYPRVEALLRREKLDFLEINYSLAEREAEDRLLPLARERGVAVVVNRPFAGSELFERVRGKPVPAWAADLGCASWAQIFLKWILGNSAVTCAIPGTGKLAHLEDNLQAGIGRFPDARERARIVRELGR